MKVLIDMNLSPAWVEALHVAGFEVIHWSEIGDPRSPARVSARLRPAPRRCRMETEEQRAEALGLADDELAFYDAIASSYDQIYGIEFLRGLIHEVVQAIKRNLKVDWTDPHREDVKAAVRTSVKRVLRNRGVKAEDFDSIVASIMVQAEALYAEWPIAA